MTHPPGEVLRAYAAGATELTRRLLVEAHLTLCRECFALVPQYRDPRDRLPEATITDEVQMPGFERVWYAVERAGEAKVCPQAATVLPGPFSAWLPAPAALQWITMWPQRTRSAVLALRPSSRSRLK